MVRESLPSCLCSVAKVEKRGGGGARDFMSRVILLLTVAYYGDFLKLSVASAGNNANRKMDNYRTANCGGHSVIYDNTRS